jgi:hypothetical protein
MPDVASDLKQRFEWAMYLSLEAYVVLPDGKSFERSNEDEYAIGVFKNLREAVDAVPPSLIEATEKLRAAAPEKFEEALVRAVQAVGFGFSPTSATEFIEVLNQTVQRDMAAA